MINEDRKWQELSKGEKIYGAIGAAVVTVLVAIVAINVISRFV